MPQPLDYRGPRREDEEKIVPPPPTPRAPARVVMPVEFDTLLTDTRDHAAARAIEVQLGRERIAVFRSEEPGHAGRGVSLYVRVADHVKAAAVAAAIFARRRKVKELPRQDVARPWYPGDPDAGSRMDL